MKTSFVGLAAAIAVTLSTPLIHPAFAQKAPAPQAVPQIAPAPQPTAPDADTVAAARELLEASGAARQFEAVVPLMMNQMQSIFLKLKPTAEKDIREVFGEVGKRIITRKGEIFEEIAQLYATRLTAAELRELAAFYKTGVGAKFVAMQPDLVQQSMAIGQRWGRRIGEEVDADVRRELKKRGVDL